MGSSVSTGTNNDDLVDNLLDSEYIKTSMIERVFRAVDRGEYFLPEARDNAYKDLAWKSGHLHLSAPCIYSEVMEGLNLEPGLSFLNLGSGTGYLSTLVGLILGSSGINHGVEIYKDVVEYANLKLENFKRYSGAIDEFDFCEPLFIQGNCLCLRKENIQYDRVYCGAGCPEQYEIYMRNLVKIGGILVMPVNDKLLQITRTSETDWGMVSLLPVSFASLIHPVDDEEPVDLMDAEPMTLQFLCRSVIRTILRKNITLEHPPVKRLPPTPRVPKKRKRTLKKMVVPLFHSSSDDDSSDEGSFVRFSHRNGARGAYLNNPVSARPDGLLNLFLGTVRDRQNFFASGDQSDITKLEAMETDTTNESTDENDNPTSNETQVHAVIEHNPSIPPPPLPNVFFDVFVDAVNVLGNRPRLQLQEQAASSRSNDETDEGETSNEAKKVKPNNREKLENGIGDIEFAESITNSSDDKLEVISSSDEEIDVEQSSSTQTRQETEHKDDATRLKMMMYMYNSPYSEYMKEKINELPLPKVLKLYLNYYRELGPNV